MLHHDPLVKKKAHTIISELIENGSRVLDLGCGEGELLCLLKNKGLVSKGSGVEVSEEKVSICIQKGLSVHHSDIDEGLADYPDKSFDYVILSETLQEVHKPKLVIQEMLRVGKKIIVTVPNFGHWRNRCQLFFLGKAPVSENLPHPWYDTPNIHFFTTKDFILFCKQQNLSIVHSVFTCNGAKIQFWPNLFAEEAFFVLM
jgi:methionine biosynthesis protein MetW